MKRILCFLCACALAHEAIALSTSLPRPEIFFAKDYDTNRAAQIESVLREESLKYLNGLTSYWEPEFSTTLAYGGNAEALNKLLAQLHGIEGLNVNLTFSLDLSKEAGSALSAGSWWVKYSHTQPDTITIRINLAAEETGKDKLELRLPKGPPSASAGRGQSGPLDETAVLEIAKEAVRARNEWEERAEFEMPRRRPDGSWSVVVWSFPKTPGGHRIIMIDAKGNITDYIQGR